MTSRTRQLLAAAVLASAAVGVGGLTTAPAATAATCSSGSGVSVVVDFGALGGGVQTACMAGGAGQSASSLFTGAGFDLSYVANQPGFVCRINQRPSPEDQACVNTPPEDAYWALWWSDGTSGDWVYSNYGVGSLRPPDGGYVGFAWQTGSQHPPNISPQPHVNAPSPTPSSTPTSGGGGSGGHGNGGGGHGSATPTAKPSSKPSSKPPATSNAPSTATTTASGSLAPATASPDETSDVASPTATPTLAPSDDALPTASDPTSAAATASDSASITGVETSDASSNDTAGALPAWAVPLVLLALAAGGGAMYLLRRRHRTSP